MTAYGHHAAPPRFDDAALARLAAAHLRGARLIVDYKSDGRWYQHLNGPMDHADLLADIADAMARRRGVEEVALSVEVRDAVGRYVRRRLLHMPARIPADAERSLIAGFDAGQWNAFIGSWLEQVDGAAPEAAAIETAPMRKPPAPPQDLEPEPAERPGFLSRLGFGPGFGFKMPKPTATGPSEFQTAALALGIPALAFALFLGLQLNALAGHFGAAPAPAQEAASRLALADIASR